MKALARMFGALAAIAAVIALAGCGGGMQAGVGSGGSGAPLAVGLGTVTGFGSIIVNGERYDESMAEVMVDERPDRPRAATVAAIRLGMHAELQHRNLVVATATVSAEVIGPISSLGTSSFVALGQTVLINSDSARPTAFEGFGSLADLAVGSVVEVHGDRADNGDILATRVELRPAGLALVRVAGTATDVNGSVFRIATLAIDASAATVAPAGAAIANGQRVVVWTDVPYTGGSLTAKVVRVGASTIAPNAAVTLDGVIGAFRGTDSLRVSGVPVNAAQASITGGTVADLRNGLQVRVRGTFTGSVLNATSVEILQAAQAVVQLTGPVTDFVTADAPFRIRNTLVRATPQTSYANGAAANLGNGTVVKASGTLSGSTVDLATVEFLPMAADVQGVVSGRITGPISPIAGDGSRTFGLEGLKEVVKTTSTTTYRNGTAADVAAGRQVRVAGSVDKAQFVAAEVEFLDNPANPPSFAIDGVAGNVRPDSVVVNGQRVQLSAATTYTLDGAATTITSLREGVAVEVIANLLGGTVAAVSIEIASPTQAGASVRGLVSGRSPPDAASFMVGSQRVSVGGNPQVLPASKGLANVVNGVDIKVEGTVSNGVLNAARIQFK